MPNRELACTICGRSVMISCKLHRTPNTCGYPEFLTYADRVIAAGYMTREEALEMRQEAINSVASMLLDGDFNKLWQKQATDAGWKSPEESSLQATIDGIPAGEFYANQVKQAVEDERIKVGAWLRDNREHLYGVRNMDKLILGLLKGKSPESLKGE